MSAKKKSLRTWVELDSLAAAHNLKLFREITKGKSKIMSVIKSNAYGHGLFAFSKLMNRLGVDGFCVDSFTEAEHLRQNSIKKPILVLGYTFPEFFPAALKRNITLTVSSRENLKRLAKLAASSRPDFHLKIDTGMNRQGFYLDEIPAVAKFIAKHKLPLKGIFTHFSAAKDINNQTYTREQFNKFLKAEAIIRTSDVLMGRKIERHVAATGGTLVNPNYHLDWVRLGIGLYGLWPSKELERQLSDKIELKPVLSWRAVVSEVKNAKKWDLVGYDLTECLKKNTRLAVIPIGYWHGFSRSLSGIGHVIIRGRKARILGRVSMDMIVVDATGIPARVGDVATIIGRDGEEEIGASDIAEKSGTSHYEFLTRINPLIERKLRA